MRWSALGAVAPVAAVAVVLFSCHDPFQPPTRDPHASSRPSLALVGAAASGSWSAPFTWPFVSAHLSVLPNRRVLGFVSTDIPGSPEAAHVTVWNPETGSFADATSGAYNAFCSGHTFLPDGRLLVIGGHITDDRGLKTSRAFNFATSQWDPVADMHAGRWYPTASLLVNGQVMAVAGSDENSSGNAVPEVWDQNTNVWKLLRGAPRNLPYYPWMFSSPDGRLFNAGPDQVTQYLNPSGGGEWTVGPTSHGGYREWGGSVMYAPGKILIVGGDDPPINTAEIIDLNAGGTWQFTGSMQFRRRQMNSTILPDGTVLVIGGTSGGGFNDESKAILPAELWNPATGTWKTLASMQVPRVYHSASILLPDARVLTAGGGRCVGCTDHLDAEIFSPPYLFAPDGTPATRPQIDTSLVTVSHGQAFSVPTTAAATISRVTWVSLPAATHTYNQNQWTNELAFTKTANSVVVTTPASAYLAPPGPYMLFILDGAGVPSVAKMIKLQGTAPLPAAPGPPAAPSNLVATSVDGQQIRLTWNDNSTSETDFFIEQCLGATCTNFAEVARVDAKVNNFQANGLASGTAYRFRVRALNEAGYSNYSPVAAGSTTTGAAVSVRTIVSTLANKCVETEGGGQLNGTRIFITPCTTADNRQWRVPPAGFEGDMRMFGTMCFDAFSGLGKAGDRIVLWECHGGPNQRWTLGADGTLKGNSGLCVTLNGSATADSTGMAIQPCTGAPSQKWAYGLVNGDRPPVAQFTVSCNGRNCYFSSSGSSDDQGIASRAWDFGDGTAAGNIVSPYKVYAAGGTYRVTLTVTDVAGQVGTLSKDVVIAPTANQAPVANFTPACVNLTCNFTDSSTDGDGTVVGRNWTFGDGGTSTQTNPSHAYAAAGTYTVTLTVTDDKGAPNSVSKSVSPTAPLPPPSGVPIAVQASGKCLAVQSASRTSGTPIVLSGCLNHSEQRWTMPSAGSAGAITVYDASTCMDAAGGGGHDGDVILIWPCHNGPRLPGPNQTWAYTAAGELKGINGKCIAVAGSPNVDGTGLVLAPCSGSSIQKYDVGNSPPNNPPVAAFTPSCTNLVCSFTDGSTDSDGLILSWGWTFGDGSSSSARNPTRGYTAAGTYTVTLTVTDDDGAPGSTSKTVTVSGPVVNQPPVADFSSSCTPGTCSFTDASTDIDGSVTAWNWTFGDGGTSTLRNPTHAYAAGSYTVVLQVTDDKGATTSISKAVAVTAIHSIMSVTANKCVEVEGGGQLNGTRIFIVPCTSVAKQQWTVPAVGVAGTIRMFNTMCFDAYSGQGNDGDKIILWECHGGPNQRWTLTPGGDLRGDTGKCVTLNGGATADFTEMAIFPCTGAPSQRWALGPP